MNKEKFKETLKYGKCMAKNFGCINSGTSDHTCPYNADVHNDHEFKCNCCEMCTNECAMDI